MDRKTIELNGMEELRKFLSQIGENTLVTIQVEIADNDQETNDSVGILDPCREKKAWSGGDVNV